MLFNSIEFAIYLPLVFAIYWLLRKNLKLQNLFVVIASYVFYGWWNWRFLCLIALTSLLSWGSGLLIQQNVDTNIRAAKGWLAGNVVVNLLILGVFKYFNFFVGSFCDLFGIANSITLQVILPVGISFYTFQALSYSIDVYRQKIAPTKEPVAFFAYVSFFPQLVAGPIERATNLLPQFEKARVFNYDEAVDGCRRILWGLFKKIVVADNCAKYVDMVWADYANQSGSTLALAAVLFAFQIYGDFSGYSDIAIGTAKLFGISLKDNFLTPYFSRNVAEFWKRWHISLNTWFVDYVYIPFGGSRKKNDSSRLYALHPTLYTKMMTVRNTFIIFLLSGLWHGANWTYVTWGLYHALLFVPLILLGRTKAYQGAATWKQIPQILLTFVLVVVGWIIFRATSISEAYYFVMHMCSASIFQLPYLTTRDFYLPLMIAIVVMLMVEWSGLHRSNILFVPKCRWLRYTGYICVVMIVLYYFLINIGNDSPFIYFQF